MRRFFDQHGVIGFIEKSVIVLAAFNILLWSTVFAHAAPTPAAAYVDDAVRTDAPEVVAILPVPETIGLPNRISIPSIGLDAAIEHVGLSEDNAMDVPQHPGNTAWFSHGPRPGEQGSAVIDGHVDWYDGNDAVFSDLRKVRPGDKITVQDDAGVSVAFIVRESRTYDAAADALEVFSSSDGLAHLNLITCDGKWDRRTGDYPKRLVVFADREDE